MSCSGAIPGTLGYVIGGGVTFWFTNVFLDYYILTPKYVPLNESVGPKGTKPAAPSTWTITEEWFLRLQAGLEIVAWGLWLYAAYHAAPFVAPSLTDFSVDGLRAFTIVSVCIVWAAKHFGVWVHRHPDFAGEWHRTVVGVLVLCFFGFYVAWAIISTEQRSSPPEVLNYISGGLLPVTSGAIAHLRWKRDDSASYTHAFNAMLLFYSGFLTVVAVALGTCPEPSP